jgi:hypothetical protein
VDFAGEFVADKDSAVDEAEGNGAGEGAAVVFVGVFIGDGKEKEIL